MKKLLLAFAAAATLGLAALAPGAASAASTSISVGPAGLQFAQYGRDHRDHRGYDRRYDDRRRDRGWQGRRYAPREVCEVRRVRQWTHNGWRVKNVRHCYPVRRR